MRSKPTRPLITMLLSLCLSTSALSAFATAPAAPKPPMGWNSWNHFGHRVTDQAIRDTADAMVASGMRDAGYIYVNIDDTWEGTRDTEGHIHPNEKFPDMKALADYVHSKGLKLGIYSSPGAKICAGFEGSLGHEEMDAQDYAKWGIDYLKYDSLQLHQRTARAGRKRSRKVRRNHAGDLSQNAQCPRRYRPPDHT